MDFRKSLGGALFLSLLFVGSLSAQSVAEGVSASVIVVVGAPGADEFSEPFIAQADAWKAISDVAGARIVTIGREGESTEENSDHDRLQAALAAEDRDGLVPLWLVLIGHGTFNGKEAKFNLRGPDVTSDELAGWLARISRPLAIIDTSSSSAPFLNTLSGLNRVVVTATRSGYEQNYTRFGRYFVEALLTPESDLDKDGEISLLEGFLYGSAQLAEFYSTEGRLASEHPLIDDNGDKLGTPPDWYRGIRATTQSADGTPADGPRAKQFLLIRSEAEQQLSPEIRAERDALELEIETLRARRAGLTDDEYYGRLEAILLRIAAVYESTD